MKMEYRTSDLYLACYLKAKFNLPITELVEASPGRFVFVFELANRDPESIVSDFYNRKADVNVKAFTDEIANLKSLVHNHSRFRGEMKNAKSTSEHHPG